MQQSQWTWPQLHRVHHRHRRIGSQDRRRDDVEALDRLVNRKIVERFDHRHLNDDPAFQQLVTTGENLVKFIWDELVHHIPMGRLEKVGLIETRDNYFEYRESVLPEPQAT